MPGASKCGPTEDMGNDRHADVPRCSCRCHFGQWWGLFIYSPVCLSSQLLYIYQLSEGLTSLLLTVSLFLSTMLCAVLCLLCVYLFHFCTNNVVLSGNVCFFCCMSINNNEEMINLKPESESS